MSPCKKGWRRFARIIQFFLLKGIDVDDDDVDDDVDIDDDVDDVDADDVVDDDVDDDEGGEGGEGHAQRKI